MPRTQNASKRRRLAHIYKGGRTLLSLPPEIRNLIWAFVVTQDEPVPASSIINEHLRFARTCRQVYAEAYMMYFIRNRFDFYLDETTASHEALLTFLLKLRPEVRKALFHDAIWSLYRSTDVPQTAPPIDENSSLGGLFQQINSLELCPSPGDSADLMFFPEDYSWFFMDELGDVHGANGSIAAKNPAKRYILETLVKYVKPEYLREQIALELWSFVVQPNKDTIGGRALIVCWDFMIELYQDLARSLVSTRSVYPLHEFWLTPDRLLLYQPMYFLLIVYPIIKMESMILRYATPKIVQALSWIVATARKSLLATYCLFRCSHTKLQAIQKFRCTSKSGHNAARGCKRRAECSLMETVVLLIALWPLLVCLSVCLAVICIEGGRFMTTLGSGLFDYCEVDYQRLMAVLAIVATEIVLRVISHQIQKFVWQFLE